MSSESSERFADRGADLLLAHLDSNRQPLAAVPAVGDLTLGRLLGRLPIGIVSLNSRLGIEYLNTAAVTYLGPSEIGSLLPDPWPVFSLRKFAARLFTSLPAPRRIVETRDGLLLEVDGIPPEERQSALLLLQDVTARERHSRGEREFVANAAHELRTPIAAISSAVEVLQAGAKENPADRDLFLQHIERESDRLVRLTGSLLQLARIQSGDRVIALRLVDVRPLLDDVARELDPPDGVEIRVSCESGLSALADHDLLCQAVRNIAENAVRHTTAGLVELACRDEGQACEIEIRDTGPGIAEHERERVFERFFRADGSAKGGFGLGLAITREIARALGGTLEIDSVPGAGTRVRFRLPAARVIHR
jgi:signal transduction histidine kinase